jgi:hypothetical protein
MPAAAGKFLNVFINQHVLNGIIGIILGELGLFFSSIDPCFLPASDIVSEDSADTQNCFHNA